MLAVCCILADDSSYPGKFSVRCLQLAAVKFMNVVEVETELETLPSIEDRGQTDRVCVRCVCMYV